MCRYICKVPETSHPDSLGPPRVSRAPTKGPSGEDGRPSAYVWPALPCSRPYSYVNTPHNAPGHCQASASQSPLICIFTSIRSAENEKMSGLRLFTNRAEAAEWPN